MDERRKKILSLDFEATAAGRPPLAVDLDGTLVRTDLLHEAVLALIKTSPTALLQLPFWMLRGKAVVKQRVAELVPIDVAALPYDRELLEWLQAERASGRRIVLATAASRHYANAVANHLGVFDTVFASDESTNLAGVAKRELLVQTFGERRFVYAGNAQADLHVWSHSAGAVLVNASPMVCRRAESTTQVERRFPSHSGLQYKTWWRALRGQQWLKNLLVFVPLLMSHQFTDLSLILAAWAAFIAFSLVASGTYMLNDLLDLGADRSHPRKKARPFAAGQIPVKHGVLVLAALIAGGLGVSLVVSPWFFAATVSYLAITLMYSLSWKRVAVLDVCVLAMLYTLRVLAGGAAVSIAPSFWLLAFSLFVFLSLAILKRFVELTVVLGKTNDSVVSGRGYHPEDAGIMSSLGVASGVGAALVLALYVDSSTVAELYTRPWLIWLVCPLFLYWIARVWLKAHRGEVHDDPVVFALTDRVSLFVASLIASVFILAT
jgi:4-hydroxybenzoate polyprenyltransferase/phosphoserine phosphatase